MVDAKLFIDVMFRGVDKELNKTKRMLQSGVAKAPMIDTQSILQANTQLLSLGKTYNRLADAGLLNNKIIGQMKQQFVTLSKTAGQTITNVDKQFRQLTKSQKAFNFNFLTFLFAGMMLQRVFGGALRSIVDSYKKMTGMNSEFNKGVLKLSASWNFLKLSIANALNSPVVIRGLQMLTDGLETMADFFLENEWAASALLGTLAGMFALGSISVFIGSLMQLKMMFTALVPLVSAAGGAMSAGLIAAAAAIALAWYNDVGGIQDLFKDMKNDFMDTSSFLIQDTKNMLTDMGVAFDAWAASDFDTFNQALRNMMQNTGKFFTTVFAYALTTVLRAFNYIWDLIFDNIIKGFQALRQSIYRIWNDIVDAFKFPQDKKVRILDTDELIQEAKDVKKFIDTYYGGYWLEGLEDQAAEKLNYWGNFDTYADDTIRYMDEIKRKAQEVQDSGAVDVAGLFGVNMQAQGPMSLVQQNNGLQSSISSTNDFIMSSTELLDQDTAAKQRNADATERLANANQRLFQQELTKFNSQSRGNNWDSYSSVSAVTPTK